MRLINTRTGLFEEFIGRNIPKYAILSHMWEEEEVSFKDMSDPSYIDKKGYRKIERTCRIASEAGLNYAWIDTCSIDKSSSAELTEAINSMYRWYQRAEVCYAFLSDLPASSSLDTALPNCRWFTRGWTLQELIAPRTVYFYDQDWNYRGSKRDWVEDLSRITGINASILRYEQSLSSVLVAQKMSWAAHRETTRAEDIAYCLFGIFDVNMPLLYGEEEKAFQRLQEEILKSTADFSIFAWKMPLAAQNTENPMERVFCGVLAETPLAFADCTAFRRIKGHDERESSISNTAIKSKLRIIREPIGGGGCRAILPLDCFSTSRKVLGARIRKCGFNRYIREDPWSLVEFAEHFSKDFPEEVYLLTKLPETSQHNDFQHMDMGLYIARSRPYILQTRLQPGMKYIQVLPSGRFDVEDQVFVSGDPTRDSAMLKINFRPSLSDYGLKTEVNFDCICFVVGWSKLEVSCLQCSLVCYQSFTAAWNEVKSDIAEWDHTRFRALRLLEHYSIPKVSSAAYNIPGTKFAALVSFTPTLVSNPKICLNQFWNIDFSFKIYKTKDLPKVLNETWIYK